MKLKLYSFVMFLMFTTTTLYAFPIPDTGITKCYDNNKEIPCPTAGQDFYGQDANYSINPMSYTKLDATGVALPITATTWAMVKDNVTGLIWENNSHVSTWDNAPNVIAGLNNTKFGGYSDWRLPTLLELSTIIDYSIPDPGPTIDTNYFKDMFISFYWSSSTDALNIDGAWGIYLSYGGGSYFNKDCNTYVRAVRGGQSVIGHFDPLVINGDRIVSDNTTGLMWQQDTAKTATGATTMVWKDALSYCENLTLGGYTDWRLPTAKELRSIADYTVYSPAINTSVFKDTFAFFYWSSSTYAYAGQINYAWGVLFDYGYDYGYYKSYAFYVRAVRGGQSQPTSGMGKAIILAGGGGNTTLYPYSNKLCQQMYRLLKQRGFTDDDIIYMNPQAPDIDANGYLENELLDYNLFEPQKHLKEAFAKAVQSFAQTGNQGQFIFYVHGHADKDYLKITRDYEIPAAELKALINTVPASVQQVIILDTCYSGSFMDELAAQQTGSKDRIVITSADDKTVAWNTGTMGFSDKLISRLRQGDNLQVAFESAEDLIKGNRKYFGEQTPQLDDNGDGFYNAVDGVEASNIYIGKEGVQAAEPPVIQTVHPVMEIAEGKADGVIWVKTYPSGEGRIKTVKAVLMPPDLTFIEYQGEDTQFSEITLELKYNAAQDQYEVKYENFRQKGKWEIAYQAQGLDGQWSEIKFGEINAGGATNAISVAVGLNQSEYLVSDKLLFDVTLNGKENIDLYVALIFPQGYFMSFAYPLSLSFPNQLIPYQSNIEINGLKTFNILELTLPKELGKGTYMGCAAATQAGSDPWAVENWFCYDCKNFELK